MISTPSLDSLFVGVCVFCFFLQGENMSCTTITAFLDSLHDSQAMSSTPQVPQVSQSNGIASDHHEDSDDQQLSGGSTSTHTDCYTRQVKVS